MTRKDRPTVLVPGAAGSAGVDALRRLSPHYRTVAVDHVPNAAGYAFSDVSRTLQSLETAAGLSAILDVIEQYEVAVVLPTSRRASLALAGSVAGLRDRGAVFAGSALPQLTLCDDKLEFAKVVGRSFPVPGTVKLIGGAPSTFPCFVKPRRGAGGKHSKVCVNREEWEDLVSREDMEFFAQEFIKGTEYSVDVLSDFEAVPLLACVRVRARTNDGVSTLGSVVRDQEIENLCLSLVAFLGLTGPACVQVRRDSGGGLYVQEVNARLGGSTVISAIAGADLFSMTVELALGRPVSIPPVREVTVVRYLGEAELSPQLAAIENGVENRPSKDEPEMQGG